MYLCEVNLYDHKNIIVINKCGNIIYFYNSYQNANICKNSMEKIINSVNNGIFPAKIEIKDKNTTEITTFISEKYNKYDEYQNLFPFRHFNGDKYNYLFYELLDILVVSFNNSIDNNDDNMIKTKIPIIEKDKTTKINTNNIFDINQIKNKNLIFSSPIKFNNFTNSEFIIGSLNIFEII